MLETPPCCAAISETQLCDWRPQTAPGAVQIKYHLQDFQSWLAIGDGAVKALDLVLTAVDETSVPRHVKTLPVPASASAEAW
ncbi:MULTISPECIES: hypothetical protein [unclassified Rhizobium]|uniref:hypothetical protein n=1 Tax=unclassified Rhizobium TaxID=2613769 RepID=UPI001ADC36AF|nr:MULTISPECIES: hypothetical protein [unclassified Rhizobium]MBO9099975.1 hypothetical protein [Rhizobium sp. L58/93]QXZ82786.1 hypothetical protein J5287_11920 [Rhizobium sp. K1/93]QXZ89701.1 hypothetical protein J5280_16670 [Rhizobium sp. K15/93]